MSWRTITKDQCLFPDKQTEAQRWIKRLAAHQKLEREIHIESQCSTHTCAVQGARESQVQQGVPSQGRDGSRILGMPTWPRSEGEVKAWHGVGEFEFGDVGSRIDTLTRKPLGFKNEGCLGLP